MTPKENIRELRVGDYHKGFLDLLSHLTKTPSMTFETFKSIFNNLKENHPVYVLEEDGKIVASGALLLDQKFSRGGALAAHIEDIVVHRDYQKKNLGRKMVEFLIAKAKEKNSYKIMLDCSEDLVEFYRKLGFEENSKHMVIYEEK